MTSNLAHQTPLTVIRPSSGRIHLNLREIWDYRDLLYMLIVRDIKIRYKQTVVGIAWAVLQPGVTALVFSVLFGAMVGIKTDGAPYPLFAYCALAPWTYLTHALTKATNSVVEQQGMITKVYFPRLILPLASVTAALMDFVMSTALLLVLLLVYGIRPTLAILTVPFFVLLVVAMAYGIGLWLGAINVQYRDVANLTPFLLQVWLFVTPVFYSSQLIPEQWRTLYGLNPMAGVVEGFRWAFLGQAAPPGRFLAVSTLAVVGVVVGGLYFFRHREEQFADVV